MNNNYRDFSRHSRDPDKSGKLITQIFLICLLTIVLQANVVAQEAVSAELSADQKIQKAKEYHSAGKQFIQQGNYSAADREFKKAQQLLGSAEPKDTRRVSKQDTDKVQSVSSGEVRSPAVKAWEAGRKGKSEEAILYYLEAIVLKPQNTSLHYNLAIEYLRTSQFKKASEAFKRVIQLNPKDKDAYYNLGVLYDVYLDDKEGALGFYNQYVKLADKTEDISLVKAWIRQIQKEMKNK